MIEVLHNGTTYEFPDEATPDQIRKALGVGGPKTEAPMPPPDVGDQVFLTTDSPPAEPKPRVEQPVEDNSKGRLRSAAATVGRSAVETLGAGFKGLGVANTRIGPSPYASLVEQFNREQTGLANPPPQMTPAFKTGEAVEEAGRRMFQPNPKFQGEWLAEKIPQGLGSTLGLAPAALLGPGAPIGVAVAGAMVNGVTAFDDAKSKGADDDDATRAFWWNAAGGTSEAVPIANIISRINKASGGAIKKWIFDVAKSGIEEGAQEAGQQTLQNIVAKHIYASERKVLEGVGESGAVGAIVGMILPGVGGGAKIATEKVRGAVGKKVLEKLREKTGPVEGGGTGGMVPVEPEIPATGGAAGTVINFTTKDGQDGTVRLAPGTAPAVGIKALKTQSPGVTISEVVPLTEEPPAPSPEAAGEPENLPPAPPSSVEAAPAVGGEQQVAAAPLPPVTEENTGIREPESQAVTQSPASLSEAWEQYDGSGTISTVRGLVDVVDSLISEGKAPKSLRRHIESFRKAVEEDRSEYGERSGLVEEAGERFEQEIRKRVRGRKEAVASPTSQGIRPEFAERVSASGTTDLEIGTLVREAKTAEEIALVQAKARASSNPVQSPPAEEQAAIRAELEEEQAKEEQSPTKTPPPPPPPADESSLTKLTPGMQVMVGFTKRGTFPHKAKIVSIDEDAGTVQVRLTKDKKYATLHTSQVSLPRGTVSRRLNEAQFAGMTDDQRRQAKRDAAEFDDVLRNEGWRLDWYDPHAEMVEGKEADVARSKQLAAARRMAFKELAASEGLDPQNPVHRAKLLPKLKQRISEVQESSDQNLSWSNATKSGAMEAASSDLVTGAVLDIEGEKVRVREIDAYGNVTLDDGKRFGTQKMASGETIWIESATLPDGTEVKAEEAPDSVSDSTTPQHPESGKTVVVVDVDVGKGKSGKASTGPARYLARNADELSKLRDAAAKSVSSVPESELPSGKTKSQVIDDVVSTVLSTTPADVSDVNLPGGIVIRLRTERAANRGVTEKTVPIQDPDAPASLEDKLRSLKTDTRGMVMDVGAATYYMMKNAAIDVAIGLIRAGRTLNQAVRDAMAWVRTKFPEAKVDTAKMEAEILTQLASVPNLSSGGLQSVQRVLRQASPEVPIAKPATQRPFDINQVPLPTDRIAKPSSVTEAFDPNLQKVREVINTDEGYQKGAIQQAQDNLLRSFETAFYGKDPSLIPWWYKLLIPRARLNEAHRIMLPAAAELNAVAGDAVNGYTFEPFEQRADTIPVSIAHREGLTSGSTYTSTNWRGQTEQLIVGPKVKLDNGREVYQLLRHISVRAQQDLWHWMEENYPEFMFLLDMWINPALRGARITVNGVEVPVFNRWALMDRYGEGHPEFASRPAYTPDVAIPSMLAGAGAKWLKERKWTFQEGVRSAGRKYETGAARERGAVLDLISGWSVRTAEVLREESRRLWQKQVFESAVDIPSGDPDQLPKGWVPLKSAVADVITAVKSMHGWAKIGFDQIEMRLADQNNPEFAAFMAELNRLKNIDKPKMLPKHVAESLIRDMEQQYNLGWIARSAMAIHNYITKDPARAEEWARKWRRGLESWAGNFKAFLLLMPRTYLVNRTDNYLRFLYASWQRMVYAAMRGGDKAAFSEAMHLAWASMVNVVPGVRQAFNLGENELFNEAIKTSLVPQLFDQQTGLADLQVYGPTVRNQVRSLWDQGRKWEATKLLVKNAGVLALEATGYGNLDVRAKQLMAFNLLLANAKARANAAGKKGEARKDAIREYVLAPPREQLADALKYTSRTLLNYSDTPGWINWAARHPLISTFVAFPIFRYHWVSREVDRATRAFRNEWNHIVKRRTLSKEDRINAWADFVSFATMPAMGWGAAQMAYAFADSVLGLSFGDDDDDPRKLIGTSTLIEVDDDGNPQRKRLARDLVTSNRINMSRIAEMFGLDPEREEDWWLYTKGIPIVQSAALFHLAQSDARKYGPMTGAKTMLIGMRDLLGDMTGVGPVPKVGFKILVEVANETNKPAYSWIDPYATSVPLSAYVTMQALEMVPGQRQANEIVKWIDPTLRRITQSKALDYEPGVIEALKVGGWTGLAHRVMRKMTSGTLESDLPPKGHINQRLGEVDEPVRFGLASRVANLAGFNVKPVNREEYEEALEEADR